MLLENVAEKVCVEIENGNVCAKKSLKNVAESVCVKWKVEKKPNKVRKVFLVTLRENETQNA